MSKSMNPKLLALPVVVLLAAVGVALGSGSPHTSSSTGAPAVDETAELIERALSYLEQHLDPQTYGSVRDYEVLRAAYDDLDLGHVHLQQTHDGVPVLGGQIIVHLDRAGVLQGLTNTLLRDVSVRPGRGIGRNKALELAGGPPGLAEPPGRGQGPGLSLPRTPVVEQWVIRHEGSDHLVWSVQRADWHLGTPSAQRIFIDAGSGREVHRYENLKTIETTTATEYDGTQTIQAYDDLAGTWWLEDGTRNILTADFRNTKSRLYYVTSPEAPFSDGAEGSMHFGLQTTMDYYLAVHGRDGVDGAGGPGFVDSVQTGTPMITGAAHYSRRVNNAFWDDVNLLVIAGDGDGSLFDPLVSLDVMAHELTHGVDQFSADLIYENESGAMSESVADVFGAAVEAWYDEGVNADTWDLAEDCFTPADPGDALRYMDDPAADGDSRDHYGDRYTGTLDNGGVHWNSGIGNLAFYLASQGGNHPTYGGDPVTGIGIESASQIWYRALTTYMTSSTGFHGARVATLRAATDLFGDASVEFQAVDDAWALVGVDEWVLLPEGYASNGVGSPSVVYHQASGTLVMAFETMTGAPSAECPFGEWSIGIATSSDGVTFDYADTAPVLSPEAGTYRSCVVAHPDLMVDEAGTGLHLWFKTERDAVACGGAISCLYTGIGYAHVAAGFTSVDAVSSAPVLPITDGALGYPKVVRSDGTYAMAVQVHPDVYVATSTAADGPWTLSADPVLLAGGTVYSDDELFNPALVCLGDDAPLPSEPWAMYPGGRDRDGTWGAVLDGGIGYATSPDALAWSLSVYPVHLWDGASAWRHWDVLRHGADPVFFMSEKVGGKNRIGIRTSLVDWTPAGLSSKTCPAP